MGFTVTRSTDSLSVAQLPTVEEQAIAASNHNKMRQLEANPPIVIGSEKQVAWAKKIAAQFLFHAHAWEFKADEIELFFASRGKYAKFWIDNRNPSGNSGEGVTRLAVEKELAVLRRDRQLTLSNEAKPDTEKRSLVRCL